MRIIPDISCQFWKRLTEHSSVIIVLWLHKILHKTLFYPNIIHADWVIIMTQHEKSMFLHQAYHAQKFICLVAVQNCSCRFHPLSSVHFSQDFWNHSFWQLSFLIIILWNVWKFYVSKVNRKFSQMFAIPYLRYLINTCWSNVQKDHPH